MHVIICGGRNYIFTQEDRDWLDTLGITRVYTGGAAGADMWAGSWANDRHMLCMVSVLPIGLILS
jgi:hypothetical protein